jgi:HD-like signal output (HDOD) protein
MAYTKDGVRRMALNNVSLMITRQDLIDAAERIDPLPASVTRLLRLTNDPSSSMSDLAEVIRYDPVLTVDVLRLANSARSAVRDPVGEVSIAVARLGTSDVLGLAMKRAVQGRMTVALPAYAMDADELWRHSLTSAIAAEAVSDISTIRISGHASTAALLHDVGKLVIAKALPAALSEHLAYVTSTDPRPLDEIEREILGTDHGEVGASVVRSWDMPMSIQIALTNHHRVNTSADTLSHVIAAANALALAISPKQTSDITLDYKATSSLNLAGVVDSKIPALIDAIGVRVEEVMGAYGV